MTEKPASNKDIWRILPGILISLIALAVVFLFVEWPEVVTALQQARYEYLLLALPVYLFSYVLRTWAWRTTLMEEISFKRVFLTLNAGYLLNNVLPFRLGELGRAFLLGRTGLGFWRVTSTILIERAFDMIFAAGLLLGTLPFVVGTDQSSLVAIIVGSGVLAGLAALYLLARYQIWALAQYKKLSTRWPIFAKLGPDRIQAFLTGLSALVDPWRFLRVFGFMLSSWFLAVVFQYILLLAFIQPVKFLWPAFGLATVGLGIAVPSSPSYVGVYEGAWIGAFSLFGISTSVSLAYALIGHVLHILLTGAIGGYALALEGESLGQIFQKIRAQRTDD
jgi:glycosyltransferase 2 family protein